MLFSKLSDKKKKIIGYCLPCAAVVLVPVIDILLFCLVGQGNILSYYQLAILWFLIISPSALVFLSIFSRNLAKYDIRYELLLLALYSSLSVIACFIVRSDTIAVLMLGFLVALRAVSLALVCICRKRKITGYCLPCVVIILIPFFDILLRYAFLGPLEKYPGLVGIIATVWIPISPSLLILSAIFSYRMARTHAIYDALMVVIYIFLSYLLYTIFVPDMALFMNYLPIKAACFGLTYVITRSVRK